jgi:uncharacterized RmlC-like cupin family protein
MVMDCLPDVDRRRGFVATKPYDLFIETEGIPVVETFAVPNLVDVEVGDWKRVGGKGAYIHLDGRGPSNAQVTEIPPGGELKEQRHLFEETVFVSHGSGRTELWSDSGFEFGFNWNQGAVFAIPLNISFKHFNNSSSNACRLFSITNAPLMMNLLNDPEFVFDCEHDFENRFHARTAEFTKPAGSETDGTFTGGLLPSVYDAPLLPSKRNRGDGAVSLEIDLNRSTLGAHISEFPVGSYKKAHRHGPGAHVVLLSGSGYTLFWKGDEEPKRYDWQPGCVLVPPDKWFHQHFNTGKVAARFLALKFGRKVILDDSYDLDKSTRNGGDQIEYEDENPMIRKNYDEELRNKPSIG